MLWWKAWRESQTRFILIALTLLAVCALAVVSEPYIQHHRLPFPLHTGNGAYSEYIYKLIFAGNAKGIFALLVIFLGLGGLQRERLHNTAGFTLALPVSRFRVVATQIVMGVVELAVLALIPAILIPGLSTLIHLSYPFWIGLHFSVLWFFGGLILFAMSFFLSVVMPGEYTAPVVCYLALMVHTFVAAWRPLVRYRLNLMWVMGEFRTMRWDPAHHSLYPPALSWVRIFVMALISSLVLLAAVRITRRQDF
jgi:ABC-type transport system involved in multi-copper enzyme maturation permease subunit